MSEPTVLLEHSGGVARLYLNRPDKLNSFTRVMHGELREALGRIEADDTIRAVVISGKGRGFCAGGDIAFLRDSALNDGGAGGRRFFHDEYQLNHQMFTYGKPIVAFDGGAVDEWLWPGETGAKVQDRTPEAFASAIRGLICDPQRCIAMGQAAKRRHAFFHPDAFVQRLTAALDRAIRWHCDTGSPTKH